MSGEEDLRRYIEEVVRQVIGQGIASEGEVTPYEEAGLVGYDVHQLLTDMKVLKIIEENHPDYLPLLLAWSHLNRTSNADKKSVLIAKLLMKRAIDLILMTKKEHRIKLGEAAFVDCARIFGQYVAEDAVGGWRGRLATERIRTYRIESTRKKRGWRLF